MWMGEWVWGGKEEQLKWKPSGVAWPLKKYVSRLALIIRMIAIKKCNKKFVHKKDQKYHVLMRRMGWRLLLELEILHKGGE
jgi:hypothetical protein